MARYANETVLRINDKQLYILVAIGSLITRREEEDNNNKKTKISCHAIAKETGFKFDTCKKYLKKLKELEQ